MNKQVLIAFDPGITGAYSRFENGLYVFSETMPTYDKVVREKLLQFDLKDGKKQVIKSGPNKGNFKMKVRRPEKVKKMLDVKTIMEVMSDADEIVIERQSPRPGNSASSSFTIGTNYGKLLACAELNMKDVVLVTPAKWKQETGLSTDKAASIEMAEKLTGKKFRTDRGRLLHDIAESYLIGHWYLNIKDNK